MPISLINTAALGSIAATVAKGGTGLGSLTASSLLVGNGTSPVTLIAPGTQNQVLVSNGTSWDAGAVPTPSALSSGTGSNQWSVTFSGPKMFFAYNGVSVLSIDSAGNVLTLANVTAAATAV